jgi:GrpB-like predicted nucleotidyltransferase (UPF0157 family)
MVGLKRHTVRVVDYDPEWVTLAHGACQGLRNACGDLLVDVQHVGSTAVPDLPAKPMLDLAAAVVTFDLMPELVRGLSILATATGAITELKEATCLLWTPNRTYE